MGRSNIYDTEFNRIVQNFHLHKTEVHANQLIFYSRQCAVRLEKVAIEGYCRLCFQVF